MLVYLIVHLLVHLMFYLIVPIKVNRIVHLLGEPSKTRTEIPSCEAIDDRKVNISSIVTPVTKLKDGSNFQVQANYKAGTNFKAGANQFYIRCHPQSWYQPQRVGGHGAPRPPAPRQSAPRQSAPRQCAPRQSAPR